MNDLANKSQPNAMNAVAEAGVQREIAEVQGAIMIAKRFPRDPAAAMDRIISAFSRPGLAEVGLYQYSKGGTDVSGPSIRAAEAIAQSWGNLQFGIRELEQRDGESTVEAFAWDVETNTRQTKVFQVPHLRYTRKGSYKLDDPREIYELVANNGARRLRACILGIIPGDVIDAAVRQCEVTLKSKADTSPEAAAKMIEAFGPFGVTKQQIEARIQRRVDSISAAQVVTLKKIYASLRDGMSVAADWFDQDLADKVASKPDEPKKLPVCTDEQFTTEFSKGAAAVKAGKMKWENVKKNLLSKYELTSAQLDKLDNPDSVQIDS